MSLSAFNIRLPLDLKTWVSERAEENGRSLNSEIVQMIKTQQRLEASKSKGRVNEH
ncbi:Arc family DNA-binding protein [Agrobacterium sp. ST15.13.040]|uniref:Arc family DNA-binding protein n=1 Tax=Agrobacterium salinitolerans TaxID=1183413 RepID=A0ABY3BRM5_9HYPH|nr:Arc family DNA-binding protein [Agrobacterium salinitolerans]